MLLLIISIVASFTSVFSLIPQIIKIHRSRSSKDLSLLMLINLLVCSLSWVAYGFLTETDTIWITNLIMTIFTIILIVLKIRYTPKTALSYD